MSEEQQDKQKVQKAPKEPKVQKKPRSFNWLGLTGVILGAGALSLAGYLEFINQQRYERSISELAKQSQITQQYQQRLESLSSQAGEIKSLQSTQNSSLSTLREQSEINTKKILQLPGAERQDWLLAEVEYLLRLANQRLLMEKDAEGAENLLLAADTVLLETRDPSLHKVRSIIADEVLSLRALGAADVEGAFLQLASLQKQIVELKWVPELPVQPLSEDVVEADATWWQPVLSKLQHLVVLRNREEVLEGPLSPQQHYYLQQNLRLMLEQSQLALLQGRQELFNLSLVKAERWIAEYFQLHDQVTKAMLLTIAEIKELNVEPELPVISGSISELRVYLQDSRRQPVLGSRLEKTAAGEAS